jgi:transcriptional regulator with XRE-family HTH domain
MACTPHPGDQLRELRNRIGVTTREVEELSRRLAERTGNEKYYISNAWLTQLENKDSVPSIYKLFSLSVIYRSTFADLLAIFGIDLANSARYQLDVPLANTHRVAFETPHPAAAVTLPIRFDRSFSLEKTNLVSRAVGSDGVRNARD